MKLLTIFASVLASVEASRYHHATSPPTTSKPILKKPHNLGPIVDLGYERHQAIVNSTGRYHNFSNIPYAIPPLDERRFSKPVPINTTSDIINTGHIGHICPQAHPDWTQDAALLVALWTLGLITNIDPTHLKPNPFDEGPIEWESEDCLLLDVVVPEGVIEALEEDDDFVPLPVMVWIHGGGFTFGHKNQDGSPYGFFNASTFSEGSVPIHDSVIFVTINYRLGAFGFLSTPGSPADNKPTSNAGLYDQALALTWVAEHISKFGGDPDRVTVIGESAGASSILHHITSYGGDSDLNPDSLTRAPFQRAILQSPAFFPAADAVTERGIYEEFLYVADSSTFEELKKKSSKDLITANKYLVFKSPYAQFTFGPTVDTSFIPKPVSLLLKDGQFWSDIDGIMVAHNSLEGLLFTDIKTVENDDNFAEFIGNSLPSLSDEDVNHVVTQLYPLPEGDVGVVEKILRVANATAELSTICNAVFLIDAFGDDNVYKYVFGVEPGVHGQDIGYSFYQPPPSDPTDIYNTGKVLPSTEIVAQTLQAYIVGFVKEGDPNRGLLEPEFPIYKDGIVILGSKENGSRIVPEGEVRKEDNDEWVDDATKERCKWWGEARYWDGYEGDEEGEVKNLGLMRGGRRIENEELKPFGGAKGSTFKVGNDGKGKGKNAKWYAEWKAEWVPKHGEVVKQSLGQAVIEADGVEGKQELR